MGGGGIGHKVRSAEMSLLKYGKIIEKQRGFSNSDFGGEGNEHIFLPFCGRLVGGGFCHRHGVRAYTGRFFDLS